MADPQCTTYPEIFNPYPANVENMVSLNVTVAIPMFARPITSPTFNLYFNIPS